MESLDLNPDTLLKQNLAEATEYAKNKEYDKAILSLKQLLDKDQEHEIAMGMLAAIYLQIGMHERAENFYRQLLQINPGNPLARFQLGMSKFNQGAIEQALLTWEPMLDLENEFMAHYYSGLALLHLDEKDKAMRMFEHARRHVPDSHPLYTQLMTQFEK